MFIQVEPKDFFMYSVKFYFDMEEPNSEDQKVQDYLEEHELEPKYRWSDELDGHRCEVMQFGGCYLGKHLERIGQIQRLDVEAELLTAVIEQHLKASTTNGPSFSEEQRRTAIPMLVQEFHQDASFQRGENGELVAALDGDRVREAARRVLEGVGSN